MESEVEPNPVPQPQPQLRPNFQFDRTQGSNVWITMGLREGKNREIKNVLGALGLEVNRLIRVSYGPFQLGGLDEGELQEVRSRTLREQLGARLIERSGANFEAPIFESEKDPKDSGKKPAPAKKPARGQDRDGQGHGGAREPRDDRKPPRGRADAGKHDGKPAKRQPPRSRASNVWMGPGARPVGPKKAKQNQSSEGKKPGKPGRPHAAGSGRAAPKRTRRGAGQGSHADRRR